MSVAEGVFTALYWSAVSLGFHTLNARWLWRIGQMAPPEPGSGGDSEILRTPRHTGWAIYVAVQYAGLALALPVSLAAVALRTPAEVYTFAYSLEGASLVASGAIIGFRLSRLTLDPYMWGYRVWLAGVALTTIPPLLLYAWLGGLLS